MGSTASRPRHVIFRHGRRFAGGGRQWWRRQRRRRMDHRRQVPERRARMQLERERQRAGYYGMHQRRGDRDSARHAPQLALQRSGRDAPPGTGPADRSAQARPGREFLEGGIALHAGGPAPIGFPPAGRQRLQGSSPQPLETIEQVDNVGSELERTYRFDTARGIYRMDVDAEFEIERQRSYRSIAHLHSKHAEFTRPQSERERIRRYVAVEPVLFG
mmetsp:Transcript_15959/g.45894  ORF Transcript_15959/g.45894 Transcript_15959/m.45894 type:complete len:217 (-) Transcript_15959:555-1205(-)